MDLSDKPELGWRSAVLAEIEDTVLDVDFLIAGAIAPTALKLLGGFRDGIIGELT